MSKRWQVINLEYARHVDGHSLGAIHLPADIPPWFAWKSGNTENSDKMHFTHAEAITYAQREATKAIAAKNQLPPLTQEPTC